MHTHFMADVEVVVFLLLLLLQNSLEECVEIVNILNIFQGLHTHFHYLIFRAHRKPLKV